MITARELTTKAELSRQFWLFRPLWQISVKGIPGSNVSLSALALTLLGLEQINKKLGNIGPTCPLLIRTRPSLEASHTFEMIVTIQPSAF